MRKFKHCILFAWGFLVCFIFKKWKIDERDVLCSFPNLQDHVHPSLYWEDYSHKSGTYPFIRWHAMEGTKGKILVSVTQDGQTPNAERPKIQLLHKLACNFLKLPNLFCDSAGWQVVSVVAALEENMESDPGFHVSLEGPNSSGWWVEFYVGDIPMFSAFLFSWELNKKTQENSVEMLSGQYRGRDRFGCLWPSDNTVKTLEQQPRSLLPSIQRTACVSAQPHSAVRTRSSQSHPPGQ